VREEILDVLNCRVEEFYSYLHKATSLRFQYFGRKVETCAILNAKSGKCPSDCKFCAQSAKFDVPVKIYPLLPERELSKKALEAFDRGINRFSFFILIVVNNNIKGLSIEWPQYKYQRRV